MTNKNWCRIEEEYDPEHDVRLAGHPPVTWAEKALFDEIVRLKERIMAVETSQIVESYPIKDNPPAAITVEGLAKAFVAKDNHRECPFCDKDDWQYADEILHSEHCPFAIAYRVLNQAEYAQVITPDGIDWSLPNDPPSPTMPFEEDNGMDAAASSVEQAKTIGIDGAVRLIAKTGRNHDQGPNWYAEWNGMGFEATFGAGTSSARVSVPKSRQIGVFYSIEMAEALEGLEGEVLYSASDYGGHIKVFKAGPWVQRVLDYAAEVQAKNEQEAAKRAAEQKAQTDLNFQEVDF